MPTFEISSAFYDPRNPKCRACKFYGDGTQKYNMFSAECICTVTKVHDTYRQHNSKGCMQFTYNDWEPAAPTPSTECGLGDFPWDCGEDFQGCMRHGLPDTHEDKWEGCRWMQGNKRAGRAPEIYTRRPMMDIIEEALAEVHQGSEVEEMMAWLREQLKSMSIPTKFLAVRCKRQEDTDCES